MIEWFDSLGVYLKPLVVMAVVGVIVLAAWEAVLIYDKIYLMKRGHKRKILQLIFFAAALLLIYSVMVSVLRLRQ